jgi:putative heme-binding domain-containing protein
VIADRADAAALPRLREMLRGHDSQTALEALWTIHGLSALDDPTSLEALAHADPHVRMWAVRLLGDRREHLPTPLLEKIISLARDERHPEVRSQLASTAKRLPDEQGAALARELLRAAPAEDARDARIPLLVWWAVEAHLPAQRDEVVAWFANRELWQSAVAREVVAPRVARWLVSAGGAEGQRALLQLIESAPGEAERKLLYGGIGEGLEGRVAVALSPELSAALARSGDAELAARGGDRGAIASLIASIRNDDPKMKDVRIRRIELLGQMGPPKAARPLLDVALSSNWHSVRKAALGALVRFSDPEIARTIVANYAKLPADQGVRPAAISMLLARKDWSLELLRAIEAGTIPKQDVSAEQVERLRQHNDRVIAAALQKVYGAVARPTSEQKEREVARLKALLSGDGERGDAKRGRELFPSKCAACHRLFGQGGAVGPDLTQYDRRDLNFLLVSIVDPSAAVREEFTNFRVDTKDDQTLIGLIAARGPDSITIVDTTGQKTVIPKDQIADERALDLSIMPEGLLDGLDDQSLRDLFAYLRAEKAPPH